MNVVLTAALAVAGTCAGLWFFLGRHAEPWAPSGPDPEALDSPEAIAALQRLALEAHQATRPDEVVRQMGRLFQALPGDELKRVVEAHGRDWLAAARPRMGPATEATVRAALEAATAAAAARDFTAGREQMRVVLGALQEQAFVHPGAALIAAGMNGAWARETFGDAAAGQAAGR